MMTEARPSPSRRIPPRRFAGRRGVVSTGAVLLAALAGLAAGIGTLAAQSALPGASNSFANSGAVWSAVAFVAAVLVATVPGTGRVATVIGGLVALVGEVGGYYWIAAPADSVPTLRSEQLLWLTAAIVIGPFLGVAGWFARRGTANGRVVALLAVLAVAFGEGVYLVRHAPSARTFGGAELVVALVGALVVLVTVRARPAMRTAAVAGAAVVAVAVTAAYSTPFLL